MKEFMMTLVIVAGATSVVWWLATGADPLEQVMSAHRNWSSLLEWINKK